MAHKPRFPMPIAERAKQFLPFSALIGLEDALAAKEKIPVERLELSEDYAEELDRKMHLLHPGMVTCVIYYDERERTYLKITGMIARLDPEARILQIVNTRISFDDIAEIPEDPPEAFES
ncbi:MAG: YolD-like family protein [Lachnospiraceae bacterium]|nr:YolD-like family protein [Lachnospiraceae bacterium]